MLAADEESKGKTEAEVTAEFGVTERMPAICHCAARRRTSLIVAGVFQGGRTIVIRFDLLAGHPVL